MIFLILLLFNIIYAQETCHSKECQDLAKMYSQNMNKSVEPCDNFYQFVCGNYATNRTLIPNSYETTLFDEMGKIFYKQLKEILDTAQDVYNATIQAKRFYDSCTNLDFQNRQGIYPLKYLYYNFENWTLIDEKAIFNENGFEWEKLAGKMLLYGAWSIITPTVQISTSNSDVHILQIGTPYFYLGKHSNYLDLELVDDYREHILYILGQMGVKMNAETNKTADGIIDTETRLAALSQTKKTTHKVMTYKELKETYPNIKWDLLFHDISANSFGRLSNSVLINVSNTEYFANLNKFVKSEPMIHIYHYLKWTLGNWMAKYLHPKFQGTRYNLIWRIYKIKLDDLKNLEWNCMTKVRIFFALPLASEYIKRKLNNEDRIEIENIVQDIKNVMKTELENANWMDEKTRSAALNKLEQMSTRLDYLDFMRNDTLIEEPYKNLDISIEHWLDASMETRKIKVIQDLLKLNKKTDIDWSSELMVINAGHQSNRNKMYLAPAILQYPLFFRDAPLFVNYGALGINVGHEITHGFDTRGSYHDEKGHLRNWWDSETRKKFDQKANCFIEQNKAAIEPVSGKNYDGPNTVGESIADNGGLRIAYQAYKNEMNRKNDPRGLPGFQDYSSDQMFFISYANTFCKITNPRFAEELLTTPYLYGDSRVNFAVRDFEKFSQAFKCGADSPMNKKEEDRCRLWG